MTEKTHTQPPQPNQQQVLSENRAHLGVIEGFFGRSWSWQERQAHLHFLARHQLDFYIYAPKSDTCLRRHWQQPWPQEPWQSLLALRQQAQHLGIHFGVGLTPLDIYRETPAEQARQLRQRLLQIRQLQPDILCLLFDDMRGDLPQLAQQQLDLVHIAAQACPDARLIFCPSYYSFDPVLEKVFGTMPPGYWQAIGKNLDSHIDIFWTGEKVCSTHYPLEHIQQVHELLQRPPFLWDNYPVNDGAVKSQHLHLRPLPHSHHRLAGQVRGHALNPMNQAALSQLAVASLPPVYLQGNRYDPQQSFDYISRELLGPHMAAQLQADLPHLQDGGLKTLSDSDRQHLQQVYTSFTSRSATAPYAQEILQWLAGGYQFDPLCLTE